MAKRNGVIAALVGGVLLILAAIFGLSGHSSVPKLSSQSAAVSTSSSDEIKVVSTTPVDEGTITPTQTVTVVFSQPAQNVDELKLKVDPQVDIKAELSDDKKTLKISPKKIFGLQQGYTLFIPADAKFEPKRTLGNDFRLHFKTVDYSGV
jgi:hypothetical protein